MYPRRKRAWMHGNQETTTTARETQEPKAAQPSGDDQIKRPSSIEQAPTGPPEVEEALQKEREKSEDYLRRLQYLQADFENYRKRAEREMGEVKRYGNDRLLSDLLVIMDELELGLEKAREGGGNDHRRDKTWLHVEGKSLETQHRQGRRGKRVFIIIEEWSI